MITKYNKDGSLGCIGLLRCLQVPCALVFGAFDLFRIMNEILLVFLLVLLRVTAQGKTAIPRSLTCAGAFESEICYGCISKCSMSIIRCGSTCNSKGWANSQCQVCHSHWKLMLLTHSPRIGLSAEIARIPCHIEVTRVWNVYVNVLQVELWIRCFP